MVRVKCNEKVSRSVQKKSPIMRKPFVELSLEVFSKISLTLGDEHLNIAII